MNMKMNNKMMRVIGIGLLSVSLLGLCGCGAHSSPQADQKQPAGNSTSSTNNNVQNGGSGGDTQQNNGDSSNDNSGQSTPAPATQKEVMTNVAAALDTKVPLMLPTNVPVTEGKHLTATTRSETWYYNTKLYETDKPTDINTTSSDTPIATVEGTEYTDTASAKAEIAGYAKVNMSQELAMDLGHGIKALMEGAAGHSYITWNEGRWCIRIDSPNDPSYKNQKYPDSKKLAAEIVTYLNQYALPAPHEIGVITVNNWKNSTTTTVQWQYHEMVYQVTSNDPLVALKVAVAMKFAVS